jgi:hypothetical protein
MRSELRTGRADEQAEASRVRVASETSEWRRRESNPRKVPAEEASFIGGAE